jgi:hypothetical protein
MLTQEELLEQIIALCPEIDLDADEPDDEELERQQEALAEWAEELPESAIPILVNIIQLPQEEQNDLSPNGNGNEICGVAIDSIVHLGEKYPDAVEAAFLKLLSTEDTIGIALEGIALWEDTRMLPILEDVLEGTDDPEIAYLIGAALYAIDGPEAIRLLKELKEKFKDDPEVVEQTEQALEMLEDDMAGQ